MALEMPFQANSLPALVHKICSAEPSYSTVSQRYSATLLTLTKNLLLKNPEKRPSMGTIIKTDFIKIHISRLLSYTLKAGNGGVDSSNSEADRRPSINVNIDPEMAERDIEMARAKQREVELANISKLQQESKDTSVRQAHREEERRKLREFRQEMANRKKENGRNGSEDDTDIAVSPRNRQVDTSQVKAAPVVVPDARKYQAAGKSDYSDESSVVSSAIRGSVSPPIGPGKSLAELQAEKNRHAYERKSGYDNSSALVSQRGGGSEYESAARR